MGLGRNIGKLVKARGLSYGELARGIGIEDPQALWALVKRDSKKSDFAGRLAEFFKVPLHRLIAEDFDVSETSADQPPSDDPGARTASRNPSLPEVVKRKPLERHQLEDAARLRKIWEEQNPPISQQRFAADYFDSATQGTVWQYLNGRIPLNLEAAIKFAKGLKVKVSDISPSLARLLREAPTEDAEVSEEDRAVRQLLASSQEWRPFFIALAKLDGNRQKLVLQAARSTEPGTGSVSAHQHKGEHRFRGKDGKEIEKPITTKQRRYTR